MEEGPERHDIYELYRTHLRARCSPNILNLQGSFFPVQAIGGDAQPIPKDSKAVIFSPNRAKSPNHLRTTSFVGTAQSTNNFGSPP